jgi:NAD(P)H-flavin reductase
MSFTYAYSGDFCVASKSSLMSAQPGQCFMIDGRYMAVASSIDGVMSFVTKKDSWLDSFDKENYEFLGPVGRGFTDPATNNAIIIAGGTGIGAAISLLKHRQDNSDLQTHLIFYQRGGIPVDELLGMFGVDGCANSLIQWNTATEGRPQNPLDPFFKVNEHEVYTQKYDVFVVGPKSLVEATSKQCKSLGIEDTMFHTNF